MGLFSFLYLSGTRLQYINVVYGVLSCRRLSAVGGH